MTYQKTGDERYLGEAPDVSELERWRLEGERRDYSNIVSWTSPDQRYLLEVTLDDPVQGFLIRLFRLGATNSETRSAENRVAQTICENPDDTLDTCCRLAAAADELAAVDDEPSLGPEYQDIQAIEIPHETPNPPEEWEGKADEWEEKAKSALEEIGEPRGRPALTKKEIDEAEYYYYQWRDGDTVLTQYVAPAEP